MGFGEKSRVICMGRSPTAAVGELGIQLYPLWKGSMLASRSDCARWLVALAKTWRNLHFSFTTVAIAKAVTVLDHNSLLGTNQNITCLQGKTNKQNTTHLVTGSNFTHLVW